MLVTDHKNLFKKLKQKEHFQTLKINQINGLIQHLVKLLINQNLAIKCNIKVVKRIFYKNKKIHLNHKNR